MIGSAVPLRSRSSGKERDGSAQETGLDFFGARYYTSAIGRWMSPDWSAAPAPVPYANLANPQSLNLYAYVGNNPVTGVDPDGHMSGALANWGGRFAGPPAPNRGVGIFGWGLGELLQQLDELDALRKAAEPPAADNQGEGGESSNSSVTQAEQQSNATSTQADAPAHTDGTPARAEPLGSTPQEGKPWGTRVFYYQVVDSNGKAVNQDIFVKETVVTTKVTGNVKVISNNSNGRFVGPYPGGVFGDSVGPDKRPRPTSTYTHTTRQTFEVQVGGKIYPLSTVVRQQGVVKNGVVISVSATIVKP